MHFKNEKFNEELHLRYVEIIESANACNLGKTKICHQVKGNEQQIYSCSYEAEAKERLYRPFLDVTCHDLTLSQMTNFRLFQTERLCRQQFQIG